ncbi:hypothetical protein N798_07360 [Knoellia flava TL1]|uniref:DUF6318 domain-containing protein n=1 Tax=Knoellia flava TL1 TaxID=1385518 RepID=A0ABR4XFG4_9MICO|nr:DUF6318 family protein [Knoellia flava]KGN32430.1 hypothetical protein N798_07360 [Knoellia flava TL1]
MSYAVALATAACLALAGCADGDAAKPSATPSGSGSSSASGTASPSASPSGSASASPSATASVTVPAAARAHTEAGAIEFAKFYMLEADKAYVSLDSSTLQSLAGPNCEGCQSAIDGVAEFKSAGERQVRPSMTIAATNPLPNSTKDVAQVQVQIRAAEVDIVNAKGAVVGATETGTTVYRLAIRWMSNGWRTADLGLEQ